MPAKIIVVDYKMGNLHSVQKKLARLKASASISSDPGEIMRADKLILPGVGHFQKAMENLAAMGLIAVLGEQVLVKRKPILGICLGVQLFARWSEEGNAAGLGWVDADVVRFNVLDKLTYKVPHTGWNQVCIKKASVLTRGIPDLSEFYFVHSYHLVARDPSDVLSETVYEYPFVSALERDNIFGVQYHPEKSHGAGEQLLRNFVDL